MTINEGSNFIAKDLNPPVRKVSQTLQDMQSLSPMEKQSVRSKRATKNVTVDEPIMNKNDVPLSGDLHLKVKLENETSLLEAAKYFDGIQTRLQSPLEALKKQDMQSLSPLKAFEDEIQNTDKSNEEQAKETSLLESDSSQGLQDQALLELKPQTAVLPAVNGDTTSSKQNTKFEDSSRPLKALEDAVASSLVSKQFEEVKPVKAKNKRPPQLDADGIWLTSFFSKKNVDLSGRPFVYGLVVNDSTFGGGTPESEYPYYIIDVMRGFLLKYDSKAEGYVIDRALKKPISLDPEETTLYYLYYGYMLWELHRTEALTEEILRLLESSIQLARRSSIYAETLIRSPEHLLESPYEILYCFWEAMQGNSSELVIISDNLKEPQYAVYTNSLPPFRFITELEATQLVTCFLEKAFNGLVPGKFYNQNFIQSFKDFLVSKKGISTEVFNERISLVGVPFQNGFACIKNQAERPELLKYSHSTFVTSEINKLQLQPRFLVF